MFGELLMLCVVCWWFCLKYFVYWLFALAWSVWVYDLFSLFGVLLICCLFCLFVSLCVYIWVGFGWILVSLVV